MQHSLEWKTRPVDWAQAVKLLNYLLGHKTTSGTKRRGGGCGLQSGANLDIFVVFFPRRKFCWAATRPSHANQSCLRRKFPLELILALVGERVGQAEAFSVSDSIFMLPVCFTRANTKRAKDIILFASYDKFKQCFPLKPCHFKNLPQIPGSLNKYTQSELSFNPPQRERALLDSTWHLKSIPTSVSMKTPFSLVDSSKLDSGLLEKLPTSATIPRANPLLLCVFP